MVARSGFDYGVDSEDFLRYAKGNTGQDLTKF